MSEEREREREREHDRMARLRDKFRTMGESG